MTVAVLDVEISGVQKLFESFDSIRVGKLCIVDHFGEDLFLNFERNPNPSLSDEYKEFLEKRAVLFEEYGLHARRPDSIDADLWITTHTRQPEYRTHYSNYGVDTETDISLHQLVVTYNP